MNIWLNHIQKNYTSVLALEDKSTSLTQNLNVLNMRFTPNDYLIAKVYVNSNQSTLLASNIFKFNYFSGDNNPKYMRLKWETNSLASNQGTRRHEVYVANNIDNLKLVGVVSRIAAYLKKIVMIMMANITL